MKTQALVLVYLWTAHQKRPVITFTHLDLNVHSTVKPVSMIADALLDSINNGDLVLDMFGGSGLTLLATEQANHCAYLIEVDLHYCDVTLHRFENITKKSHQASLNSKKDNRAIPKAALLRSRRWKIFCAAQ